MPKFVKDIMNKQPKAITPNDPLHKAAALMHKHDISHLPVIDENRKVVGHIHANDVLKAIAEQQPHTTPVKRVMNTTPIKIPEKTPIAEAAAQMAKARVKGASIINEHGELSGFVHARDIEKMPNGKLHVEQIYNAYKHQTKKAA